MDEGEQTWRDDAALIVGLDETAAWRVRGAILGQVACLRDAGGS